MTTYQQKAEQYVREQLPELRRLDDPCGVFPIQEHDWENCPRCHKSWDEPQLQHWLRVLHKETGYKVTYSTSYKGGGYIQTSCLTAAQVKAKSTCIGFDMNDNGQPATEADYQAFCNIVGV